MKDISISSKYKRNLKPTPKQRGRKRSNFTTMKVSLSSNVNQNNSAQPSRHRIGGLGNSGQIKRSINLGFGNDSKTSGGSESKRTMRSGLLKFSRRNRFMNRSGMVASMSANKNRFSTQQSSLSKTSGMTLNFRQDATPARSVFDSIQPGSFWIFKESVLCCGELYVGGQRSY